MPHPATRRDTDVVARRRQMLAERFLVDVLAMDWASAHKEADAIAVAITPTTEKRLVVLMDDPGTCPHGNPIPGSANAPNVSDGRTLSTACGLVEVVRIDEQLEEDVTAMRLLEACGLIPKRWAEIVESTSFGVHLIGARANAIVPSYVAAHTWVRPVDLACD